MQKGDSMHFVNLTPHEIVLKVLFDTNGDAKDGLMRFPSLGNCRVAVKETNSYNMEVDGYLVPVVQHEYGAIEGLPSPRQDTKFIVSLMVLNALKAKGRMGHRPDVLAPDTGKTAIRDEAGQIIAVIQFVN